MVIVVGGSSFVGAYTVQALIEAGHDVLATGRNPRFARHYASLGVDYVQYDLFDRAASRSLPSEDVEAVVLLAAVLPANSTSDLVSGDNAADYVLANTVGTADLLEYCRTNGIGRLLSACSYADVQNRWSAEVAITEKTPRDFKFYGDHAAYVISKNAANDIMWYYNEQHGMENVSFRLPPVYGVGPHNTLLVNGTRRSSGIALFIEQAKTGEDITVFGDGSIARDVVYVKDVANAIVLALDSDVAQGLYNIGSGISQSLVSQAEAIAEVFVGPRGRSRVLIDANRPNGLVGYSFDISRAAHDFGYTPEYADFRDMMRDWKMEEERGVYTRLFGGAR